MNTDANITIFTDGSSRGNPGPGGWGSVIAVSYQLSVARENKIFEIGGREAYTTNNRMELQAAISALSFLESLKLTANSLQLVVYSDSSYVINGITKWVFGWMKKGWVTTQKKEVENRDLWERLHALSKDKTISWKYVGGHVGVAGNERCDQIATAFADDETIKLYTGALSSYPTKNILDIAENILLRTEKSQTKKRSGAKAYSYISAVGGVVEIHATWAECERRVKGVKGARYKKALSKEEEVTIIAEFSK